MRYLTIAFLFGISLQVNARSVDYQVEGKTFEGFYLKKSDQAPLVFIVHDWDGLTEYEKKRARMLHDLGYSVFALDMYGKAVRPTEVPAKKKMTKSLYDDRKSMRKRLTGAISSAKKLGLNTSNAVAIGYCFGGTTVLELARSGSNLKGFVSFHGGLQTPKGQDYSKTKGKILVLHGSADSSVSMTDFAQLATELEKANVAHEMITYSGAPHAFTVFGSERYRKDADSKSWERFTKFLKELTD